MTRRFSPRAFLTGLVALAAVFVPAAAAGQPSLRSSASDNRADFFPGNVVTCSQVNLPNSIQVGAQNNNPASDANVSGTVQTNNGTVQPGQGEELNVTITGANVAIDAVVVKGGNGYNVYSNPAVLPPALQPPQHYISPLTGGGNVPAISHWFICYHLTAPPPAGSISVQKTVVGAELSVQPPSSFTATVTCDGQDPVTVTLPGGGGVGNPSPALTGLAPNTNCTVVEDTSSLPAGTVVTYSPAGADDPGVTVPADGSVTVTITNDFSRIPPATGDLQVVKDLLPAPSGVTVPPSFSADVACDDNTQATVTLPGGGGVGTPTVTATADAFCTVEEVTPVPPGWGITYSVDGGPPSTQPPLVQIVANQTVTVTIVNDPSGVAGEAVTAPEGGTPEVGGAGVSPAFTG
jgi:hypothetical protein